MSLPLSAEQKDPKNLPHTFFCKGCCQPKEMIYLCPGTYGYTTNRGRCKSCHSKYTKNKALEKKVKLFPHDYIECDDCDRTMYKYIHSISNKLLKACRYCASTNIKTLY